MTAERNVRVCETPATVPRSPASEAGPNIPFCNVEFLVRGQCETRNYPHEIYCPRNPPVSHFVENFGKFSKNFPKVSKNSQKFPKSFEKFQKISKNFPKVSKNFRNFQKSNLHTKSRGIREISRARATDTVGSGGGWCTISACPSGFRWVSGKLSTRAGCQGRWGPVSLVLHVSCPTHHNISGGAREISCTQPRGFHEPSRSGIHRREMGRARPPRPPAPP